jgi:hypothetical protein
MRVAISPGGNAGSLSTTTLGYQVSPQENSNDNGTDANSSDQQLLQHTFDFLALSVLTVPVSASFVQRRIRSLHSANILRRHS